MDNYCKFNKHTQMNKSIIITFLHSKSNSSLSFLLNHDEHSPVMSYIIFIMMGKAYKSVHTYVIHTCTPTCIIRVTLWSESNHGII